MFSQGQRVRVIDGVHKGHEGLVMRGTVGGQVEIQMDFDKSSGTRAYPFAMLEEVVTPVVQNKNSKLYTIQVIDKLYGKNFVKSFTDAEFANIIQDAFIAGRDGKVS